MRLLRAGSATSLLLGIFLVLRSSVMILQATLTGPGATVLEKAPHGAALATTPVVTQAQGELFLGMLLIILGFLFYTLARIRQGARRVPVHSAPAGKKRKEQFEAINMKRRGPAYFWMEIRI